MHLSRWTRTQKALGFGLRAAAARHGAHNAARAMCLEPPVCANHSQAEFTRRKEDLPPFWLPPRNGRSAVESLVPSLHGSHYAARIDGKGIAEEIKRVLAQEVSWMKEKVGAVPGIAMVRVGDRKDSELYVRGKQVACCEVGIKSFVSHLPASASEADLLELIDGWNCDPRVHGILVQLPLPSHIKKENVLKGVSLDKDVDGLHPANLGRLFGPNFDPTFMPCTPLGCMELLARLGIDLEGRHAVVIGCSSVVGFPTALLLRKHKAEVTILQIDTPNPAQAVKKADIVISAAGVPQLVRGDWLKPGAIVIDVGISAIEDPDMESGFHVMGDVCFEEAERVASAITPVPGGVGPMTIAMLLSNTVVSAQRSFGLTSKLGCATLFMP